MMDVPFHFPSGCFGFMQTEPLTVNIDDKTILGFRFDFKPTHMEVNRLVRRRETVECLITSMLSAKRNH